MNKYPNYRKEMTEQLIAQMQQGTAPWQQPWPKGIKKQRPLNFFTKRPYKGGNMVMLSAAGYADSRWMTLKQAAKKGWDISNGVHAIVEYFNWIGKREVVDEETGEKKIEMYQLRKPMVFHHELVNASLIHDMPSQFADEVKQLPEKEVVESAERLIKESGAVIKFDAPGQAYYDPKDDIIHITPKETFKSTYDMYSCILHELGHWTGHASRLKRQIVSPETDPEAYAKEELRAELASYFLAYDLGIGPTQEHINNHASFLNQWVELLDKDRNAVFTAAKEAESIYAFLYRFYEKTQDNRFNSFSEQTVTEAAPVKEVAPEVEVPKQEAAPTEAVEAKVQVEEKPAEIKTAEKRPDKKEEFDDAFSDFSL